MLHDLSHKSNLPIDHKRQCESGSKRRKFVPRKRREKFFEQNRMYSIPPKNHRKRNYIHRIQRGARFGRSDVSGGNKRRENPLHRRLFPRNRPTFASRGNSRRRHSNSFAGKHVRNSRARKARNSWKKLHEIRARNRRTRRKMFAPSFQYRKSPGITIDSRGILGNEPGIERNKNLLRFELGARFNEHFSGVHKHGRRICEKEAVQRRKKPV